jgi:hypothetical protein
VEIGTSNDDNEITWSALQAQEEHRFLDEVHPETRYRFKLQGKLPDFPTLHAYFMGVALYNNQTNSIEDILLRLGIGPNHPDTTETISLEKL